MNLKFEDEVAQDLEKLDKELEERILSKVFELEDNPLPDNSYVIQLPDSSEIQCLKLQEQDRNAELNHRVTYDINEDEVRVYGIFPRKPGYQNIKKKTQKRR